MTFNDFLKNFKCPQCKKGLCHPRYGGNYYCYCNASYCSSYFDDLTKDFTAQNRKLYLFFYDKLYLVAYPNDTAMLYFQTAKISFIHWDTIPNWILDPDAQDRIESLLVFL